MQRMIVLGLVVIALLLVGYIYSRGGNIRDAVLITASYDCRLAGEGTGRPWQWVNGACYLQQPDGSVIRVDTNPNVK